MAGSLFDSPLFAKLFPTGETGKLFTDSAEIRAMLLVEGMLAKVQGQLGVIPDVSAAAIQRASMEIQIDPAGLAKATGQNGVCVPGLVSAFRAAMEAPEHAQYVHWGATSQDIIDTGLMLRLRQALNHAETGLNTVLKDLAHLADAHADLPMAARTWGQHATPISFGAIAAGWGAPLLGLRDELGDLRDRTLWVSLSGAAGTAGALGDKAPETRAALADALGLQDPARSWHADRSPILAIAAWLTRTAVALGKFGDDIILLAQSGIAEISLGTGGSSSTMPQKQNPVLPSTLVALARHVCGLNATLQGAGLHRQERDGSALFTEWLTLPHLVLSTLSALENTIALTDRISPVPDNMDRALRDSHGLVHAEALSFALAEHMPRPDAQAVVKDMCQRVSGENDLHDLVKREFPNFELDAISEPARQLGQAPSDATAFARKVRDR